MHYGSRAGPSCASGLPSAPLSWGSLWVVPVAVAQPSWLFPHSAGSLEENLGSGCRSQVLPSTGDRRQTSKDREPLALPALHLMLSFTEVLIIFWGRASPQPQGFGETQLCSQSRQCSFTQPHPVNVCNACNPHSELLGMILWDISRIR